MGLEDLLASENVIHGLNARCKREALEAMAQNAADSTGWPASEIMTMLLDREQLGSTGVGDGVAIPHAKIEGLGRIVGVLASLKTAVSFDALDDQPVDLVFLLLAPANATAAHLKALARVSRLLRDPAARSALRGADSAQALFAIAMDRKPNAA